MHTKISRPEHAEVPQVVRPSLSGAREKQSDFHKVNQRETLHERAAFSPTHAAAFIGVSRSTFYGLLKQKKVAKYKIGRRSIVLRKDLCAFLDALMMETC